MFKIQWQFKAFYLYGAVEPLTGELLLQEYDRVNTDNFQQFLNDFSQRYPHDFHVIQADNARFHRSNDLVMPDNVMLLYQPPYSPQVNSSERLWHWSKGEIAKLTHQQFISDALQKIGMVPTITQSSILVVFGITIDIVPR